MIEHMQVSLQLCCVSAALDTEVKSMIINMLFFGTETTYMEWPTSMLFNCLILPNRSVTSKIITGHRQLMAES